MHAAGMKKVRLCGGKQIVVENFMSTDIIGYDESKKRRAIYMQKETTYNQL